jgi:hypothetical protein
MRIAVVGSWKDKEAEHWGLTGSDNEFGEACRVLGSEIVRLGHSLIVAGELGLPARIMHEPPAATADMAALPGVLGSRTLRRTEQVRLRFEPLRLPGDTTISTISRRRVVHNAG